MEDVFEAWTELELQPEPVPVPVETAPALTPVKRVMVADGIGWTAAGSVVAAEAVE